MKRNSIINENRQLAQKEYNKYGCMGKGHLPGTVQRVKILYANQSYLLKAESVSENKNMKSLKH